MHDQAHCSHPDCQFEAEFGFNPADPFAAIPDDEPPNQCSGCDGSGANEDPENPGEFVECDVCWGEGDEERHRQKAEYQDYLADLADAASY